MGRAGRRVEGVLSAMGFAGAATLLIEAVDLASSNSAAEDENALNSRG